MANASNPARKRYVRRFSVAMAAYLITLTLALRFIGRGDASGIIAYALAVLPGLSVVGIFWAIGRLLVEQSDEFLRMLLVRQILIASALAISIATIWGFLENFDLVQHVDAYYIAILWFAGFGVGAFYNRVRFGSDGGCM